MIFKLEEDQNPGTAVTWTAHLRALPWLLYHISDVSVAGAIGVAVRVAWTLYKPILGAIYSFVLFESFF